jgi:hypothetical protein
MTVLGKFKKQPREVETYAIQFSEDMTPTDTITGGYAAMLFDDSIETELTGPYTATAADNNKLFYTGFNIVLPTGVADGFVLMASNIDQDSAISVGAFNVPARSAVITRRKAGAWVVEMQALTVIVSAPSDQRVRAVVSGGVKDLKYKGQLTATTSEGRVLEDEFVLSIKET